MSEKVENKKPTHKRMPKFIKSEYVDPKTGELVDRFKIEYEERDFNFHKIWLWHVASILDLLGSQKIRVLSHILEKMNSDNLYISTQRKTAEDAGVSKKTVTETLALMMNANMMKMQGHGVYQINPEVIFRGDTANRLEILYEYHNIKKKGAKKT